MKRLNIRIGAVPLFSLIIISAMLITWCVSMYCITNALAHSYYELMLDDIDQYGQNYGYILQMRLNRDTYEKYPGYLDFEMLDRIMAANFSSSGRRTYSFSTVLDFRRFDYQRAVYFRDKEGNILHTSGNFAAFRYLTEEQWLACADESEADAYAYMDLTYEQARTLATADGNADVIRVTGVMDGQKMTPYKLDYLTHQDKWNALDKVEPDYEIEHEDGTTEKGYTTYTYSGLDALGLYDWKNLFDNTNEADDLEFVTLYGVYCSFSYYDYGDAVTDVNGNEHENLLAMLLSGSKWYNLEYNYTLSDKRTLEEIIVFKTQSYGYENEEYGYVDTPLFGSVVATRCSPLNEAVKSLKKVYIGTFAFAALLSLLLIKAVRSWLSSPVKRIIRESDGWNAIHWNSADASFIKENHQLYETYRSALDTMNSQRAEINRLNRALEYSQKAEQERRRLTGDVAHELKTPLAVIHSYAEGLQEHIADEKRDKYLEVILSETERMDALVLQQLDLSRLEAGRIKLARDEFLPAPLIRDIFGRFDLIAEDKELDITFDLNEQLIITADEGRLSQVITNLASNAVKYTPHGGKIKAELKAGQSMFTVSVYNDSPPLSSEALEHVWDPFYRADKSRSTKGTGLGLAISKQIVELHGGSCRVYNTKSGVVFSFTIPY